MPAASLTRLRMLVSCTSELQAERKLLEEIVSGVNRVTEDTFGVTIRVLDWRRDVVPGVSTDAQQVVNQQTADCDIYFGMLGTRFGTPTPRAGSGTEEEFNAAYQRYVTDSTSIRLLFYFRSGAMGSALDIDPAQLGRVQDFRGRLQRMGVLYGEFVAAEDFITLSREHLISLVRDQWSGKAWHANPVPQEQVSAFVEQEDGEPAADEGEPGIIDLYARVDETFEATNGSIREITDYMQASRAADTAWTTKLSIGTASGVTPREAQVVINQKAAEFGRRATTLRALTARFRASTDDYFDAVVQLADFQIGTGMATKEEMRVATAKLVDLDTVVREARDVWQAASSSFAALPDATRDFRTRKRGLMQALDQLGVDVGHWLDRSKDLRTRLE
jgi:hypothetical protein